MITEDYISFETAKLLKEKGFDEPCFRYAESKKIYESGAWMVANVTGGAVGIPTLQMARKWIKENYNRHIEVRITNHSISDMVNVIKYYWIIFDAKTARWMDESTIYKTGVFDTEEQAYENAMRHILEN